VLSTKIDGKTFNPDKEHDAPGEFGKVVFAERIVRPQAATIDFSGFDPLLARIDAVLDDYAKRTAPGPAAAPTPPAAGAAPKMTKRPRAATAAAKP
jgi:RNA-directed DNA polymerase